MIDLVIDKTWEGREIPEREWAHVTARRQADQIIVEVIAPFFDDLPPSAPAGRLDRLWEYEVVELFLLGDHQQYFELELGPHGHYLALLLRGERHVERRGLLVGFDAVIESARWRGKAYFPAAFLPANIERGNAYAMHGLGSERRFLAAFPVPGSKPDFHRLAYFESVSFS